MLPTPTHTNEEQQWFIIPPGRGTTLRTYRNNNVLLFLQENDALLVLDKVLHRCLHAPSGIICGTRMNYEGYWPNLE